MNIECHCGVVPGRAKARAGASGTHFSTMQCHQTYGPHAGTVKTIYSVANNSQ